MPHEVKTPTVKLMDDVIAMFGDFLRYPLQLQYRYSIEHENIPHNPIEIQKSYNRKVIGLGKAKVKSVLIYADNENVEAFGMGAGLQSGDLWRQYMHTVSATIDVQTNVSDSEHDELVADIKNVLKYNRIYGDWVDIVVTGSKNLSGEMRGRFRTIIDIRGRLYKPEVD